MRYTIEGGMFTTLEGFFAEVSRVVIPGASWGQNLDAFNDILRGGFGTPEEGFELVWVDHALSRERLGHGETVRQLMKRLENCHPSNSERVADLLAAASANTGPTVFDWLVEIIQRHGPGGEEAKDGVVLSLQ